ncbi:MAG: hypothetical protein MUE41_00180 [Gemmatimonadaceae bacterium]|nr:hypothetical protein [Gemmatimonadaceae bacterium]
MTGPDVTTAARSGAASGPDITPAAGDAIALAAWQAELDELLRGVAHALSNRVATISAAAYMASGGEALDPTMTAALSAESDRLETLLGELRLLPAPLDARAEPVLLDDLARSAIALHRHHLPLRDVPVAVHADATATPAHASGGVLLHAMLLVLTTLRTAAVARRTRLESTPRAVQLTVRGSATHAVLAGRVDGEAGAPAPEAAVRAAAGADHLVQPLGGRVGFDAAAGTLELVLPSLAAVRAARAPRD